MNRSHLTIVSTAVLALSATSISAAEHRELFNRLDTDRNGRLTKTEVPQEHVALFKRLLRNADTNDDGLLSLAEFEAGLTSSRPAKPLSEKAENQLPGSDALLLMLAWMDRDANLTVTVDEVTPEMRPLFDEFVDLLNLKNRTRIPIPQLTSQATRFAGHAAKFAVREGIDVEVELALLSDVQRAYVDRLRTSPRGRGMLDDPKSAFMLFSRLDTDGDGKVTAPEVPDQLAAGFQELLSRADRDQDKQLSEQEFKNFTSRMATVTANRPPLAETTQRARQLIRRLDRNSDQRLSRGEAPPRMAQRFARIDRNGDGQLDQQEVARAVEILETLRNSAEALPVSTPAKQTREGIPAQN